MEDKRQKLLDDISLASQFPIPNSFTIQSSRGPVLYTHAPALAWLEFQSGYVPCLVKFSLPDKETYSFKSACVCLKVIFSTVCWKNDYDALK